MNYEKLREDLIDYFGTAMQFYPMAVIELTQVENASDEELEQIANNNGFDLSNYENHRIR